MPYELPPDPSTERRTRIVGWVTFVLAALLIVLVAYFAYVGYEGSRQLTDPPNRTSDCRTPADMGWSYEAINYDVAADATAVSGDTPDACSEARDAAGTTLVGPGDVGLAGWYIPAGDGADPTEATVIVAHGWGDSKSGMLDRAAMLHDTYNLVLFDFRNHGQSGRSPTTQGVREAGDLQAVVDWLETSKGPQQIGILGVSMGGASALNEADDDERIDALVIESTHATLANAAQARLDRGGYPLSLPGSWAILLGTLMRTGEDVSAADPIQAVERLDGRPLLIISGGLDQSIGATDADDMLAAAEEAGIPAELDVCPDAGHAASDEACAEDYPGWVLGFLDRVLAPSG
ncbi:MAG TPA: alpha/beta hydrolase [Candidatus Limnocylindrales bacterium]|nr:alpha/beta hydrolase [Candidatus Limnocylindrales bacterium]